MKILTTDTKEFAMLQKMQKMDNRKKDIFTNKILKLTDYLRRNEEKTSFKKLRGAKLLEKIRASRIYFLGENLGKKNEERFKRKFNKRRSTMMVSKLSDEDKSKKKFIIEINQINKELLRINEYICELSLADEKEKLMKETKNPDGELNELARNFYLTQKDKKSKFGLNTKSKFANFEQIQDEFNTANYLFEKHDMADPKIVDKILVVLGLIRLIYKKKKKMTLKKIKKYKVKEGKVFLKKLKMKIFWKNFGI